MNNFPLYFSSSKTKSKQEMFEGIRDYLKKVNVWYNSNMPLENIVLNEIDEIQTEIDNSLNKNVDTINLQKIYEKNLLSNIIIKKHNISLILDLIKVSIDIDSTEVPTIENPIHNQNASATSGQSKQGC